MATNTKAPTKAEIENELKSIKKIPDVVILEFTQMLLMIDIVKKYFPNAKIFASEHDVSFLRCKREVDYIDYEDDTIYSGFAQYISRILSI